ncbi:hypothetical protein K402DRAFT_195474 [Aulographum hederae CBS 113979]|uniref:Zn(2)-C6 fungal-type domain-containing protein n=1 Tax=Aulographum hederae CBS 113979 TaxID=1176131 RepID=A0A6G1GNB4_9PEZI|nr:hypothetical protein K402DRAFT_195474 [Aulographum hederae CBS 113979]
MAMEPQMAASNSRESSDSGPPKPGQPGHTRTYQACIPCRKRKVRCDLGPVDNPHDPPCSRCRRESKECYFSTTRRKRKPDGSNEDESDYELRNARKRTRISPMSMSPTMGFNRMDSFSGMPVTPGGSIARYEPLRRPMGIQQNINVEEEQKRSGQTAAMLQTREIFSGHDALNLLYQAGTFNGDIQRDRAGSTSSVPRSAGNTAHTPGSIHSLASPQATNSRTFLPPIRNQQHAMDSYSNGASAGSHGQKQAEQGTELQGAMRAWSRFRFVRAGWFTAREAISYIEYFYKYLSPLTPIVLPDFSQEHSHVTFLETEPMLAVTILTIASRFMKLSGPGATSRPYTIHEKLWNYLRGMIERMIWGQEQFGGGFCGAGAQQGSDVNPLDRKGLRTLGSVESLMLLTEWHPRAMHFPPGDDDDEIMIPEDPTMMFTQTTPNIRPAPVDGSTGQRVDSWLEPCWRSDRMCWMLLGNAMALASEIGVFDDSSETTFQLDNEGQPPEKVHAYYLRKTHLKKLLQIYGTQTSGRLGLTSMLPASYLQKSLSEMNGQRAEEKLYGKMRADNNNIGARPGMSSSGPAASSTSQLNSTEWVLHFWTEIASIMEAGNRELFSNRRATRELIKSGDYREILKQFEPRLRTWRESFNSCRLIPKHMRDILTIEYEYNRVYVNCLALQAVVERCTHNTPAKAYAQLQDLNSSSGNNRSPSKEDGGAIPAETLKKWMEHDRYYVGEVVDACRSVLKVVVEGLYPDEYLKHVPVRTYFRIISVTIILLKTFALGGFEGDVAISLMLLDNAVDAMRTCVVDDVHIANSFSDLVHRLTATVRARFVRMAGNGTGLSRAGSRSPPPHSGVQTPMPPPSTMPNGMSSQWAGYGSHLLPDSPAMNTGGRATPNHHPALYGISTQTYDPSSNNYSIMPPPTFGSNNMYDQSAFAANNPNNSKFSSVLVDSITRSPLFRMSFAYRTCHPKASPNFSMDDNTGPNVAAYSDWLALPLDGLLNSFGAEVTQSTYGPDVGGFDLLDVLLNNPGVGNSGYN